MKCGNYSMTSSGMSFIHISTEISNFLEIFRIQEERWGGGCRQTYTCKWVDMNVMPSLSCEKSEVCCKCVIHILCSSILHTLEPDRKISDSCLALLKMAPSTNLSGKDSNNGGIRKLRVSGRCRRATDRA